MTLSPLLLAWATKHHAESIVSEQAVSLIDAHYFYPDGVAAAILGRWLEIPVVITARGTDINFIPKYRLARRWIEWAAKNAAAMITVSTALQDRMKELNIDFDKTTTLRNGVDLSLFRPLPDRQSVRQALNLSGWVLLSVGHLIERKGHHIAINTLRELKDVKLVIIGDGPLAADLRALASEAGVADRVIFTGAVKHDEMRNYYNAADALLLCSSREGMANVLLESLACGTPVVATPYWGAPEVVTAPEAGRLTTDRSSEAFVHAVHDLRDSYPDRNATRRHAELFSWDETTKGQLDIFDQIVTN